MFNNTLPTSGTSQNLDPFEAFSREAAAEFAKWERALAIAGYTSKDKNIVRLRPKNITPCLEAAMGYVLCRGWDVFPADTEAKKSYLSAEYAPEHKTWGMTNDPEQLQRNFLNAKWRLTCGVGVPTGWVNRIFDIEADTLKGHGVDGLASLRELEAKHGKLPDTLMAESPSGSEHRIYNHPGRGIKIKSSDSEIAPGVDIKGDGGMFIAPPSVRSDGAYRWLNNLPIADAPDWLIALVRDDASSSGRNDPFLQVREPVPIEKIVTALEFLPNDDTYNQRFKNTYDRWYKIGAATHDGAPNDDGLAAFKMWSQKSSKSNVKIKTEEKWKSYSTSPLHDITVGTLFWMADQECPEWRDAYKLRMAGVDATEQNNVQPPQCSLNDVHKVFRKWLGEMYDLDVIDATCAAGAAEQLGGDPLWLQIISGPGAAKTETAQSLAGAGAQVISTIASEGALLSASPKKSRAKTATGGLLRKIGERGILVIKDFTSIMSADRNTRGSVLAAIREIYDGRYVRNVGTDGGQTLTWEGRIAIVAACTTFWDSAHAVVAVMGDRFVIIRIDSDIGRIASGLQAIRNTGSEVQMREELAAAVGGLVAHASTNDVPVSEDERMQLLKAADIVTKARTAVERSYSGEVVDAHAAEMPTRFAKQLAQMVRGGVAIGMSREAAMKLAIRCARDSIPPLRLKILRDVAVNPGSRPGEVRQRIGKPWTTVKREMEALTMLGILQCDEETEEVESDEQPGKMTTKTKWLYDISVDFDRETLLAMSGGIDPFEACFATARTATTAKAATVINGGPRDALWQHEV